MKTNALTVVSVQHAKPREKPYTMFDGGGLFLEITPSGNKYWRFKYRIGGKERRLMIGTFPRVSLAAARAKRQEARDALEAGRDPGQDKKKAKLLAALSVTNTFKAIAEEFCTKMEKDGLSGVTLVKTRWMLDKAYAAFGDRPITEIGAPDILAMLRTIEKAGNYETANRLRSRVGAVFRYAIATGRAERDPAADLRGALITPTVQHRAALLEPDEVGGLMRAINGYNGMPITRLGLKLLALTFVRPGELRMAEWSEIDLEGLVWKIPAARMKMRREHRVPLARQTVDALRELALLTGNGVFLFPAIHTSQRTMSENTLNAALRRMGYGQDEMTSHGFRSTASTLLNESGLWSADSIERALAHGEPNAVRRAYARGQHWDERVKLNQWWADYLDELTSK